MTLFAALAPLHPHKNIARLFHLLHANLALQLLHEGDVLFLCLLVIVTLGDLFPGGALGLALQD